MKNKIIIPLAFIIVSVIGVVSGCSKPEQPSNKIQTTQIQNQKESNISIDVGKVINDISNKLNLTMLNASDKELKDVYGLEPKTIKTYAVKLPLENKSATEIAIFEANTPDDILTIKAAINKRIDALKIIWKTTNPEQYKLVENNKIIIHNNYILFVISDYSDYIQNVFDRTFDTTIKEVILPTNLKEAEGTLIAVSKDAFTMEIQEKGKIFVVNVAYDKATTFEEDYKVVIIGDKVSVSFSEPVIEDLTNPSKKLEAKAVSVKKTKPGNPVSIEVNTNSDVQPTVINSTIDNGITQDSTNSSTTTTK